MHDPTRSQNEADPRPKYACPDLETKTRMARGKQNWTLFMHVMTRDGNDE